MNKFTKHATQIVVLAYKIYVSIGNNRIVTQDCETFCC